jgi:hypothetical protein
MNIFSAIWVAFVMVHPLMTTPQTANRAAVIVPYGKRNKKQLQQAERQTEDREEVGLAVVWTERIAKVADGKLTFEHFASGACEWNVTENVQVSAVTKPTKKDELQNRCGR